MYKVCSVEPLYCGGRRGVAEGNVMGVKVISEQYSVVSVLGGRVATSVLCEERIETTGFIGNFMFG